MSAIRILLDQADARKNDAKSSLIYYFERAGILLNSDNFAEINGIVDDIVTAAVAATKAELLAQDSAKAAR